MNELTINDWRQRHSHDVGILEIIDCDTFFPTSEDLVNKLRSLFRESYTDNQKIVFYITKDYYQQQPAGLMLQAIQRMVNYIDISNFFIHLVTTNPDIEEEYSWVLSNISTDPVPFNITRLAGEFSKVLDHDKESFLVSGAVRKPMDLDVLSDRHRDLLFKSKTFCILPWVSMFVRPNSDVTVCCKTRESQGDCSKKTLTEIWNDKPMRQLRLEMLNNKKIDSCNKCYDAEEGVASDRLSQRRQSLAEYAHLIKLVDQTSKDGYLPDAPITWLTVKINNLCNQSCRMCNPTLSSSWHKPAVALGLLPRGSKPLLIAGKNQKDMLSQIMEHLETLQQISFEGGEPLIIKEFWTILEKLDQLKRYDIALHYSTNLTRSRLKDRSIFDLWKKFDKVYVSASLDAEGSRGEYLRPGAEWGDVVNFRKEMIEKSPNVFFEIKPVLTILNALHIPDFHRSWVHQGLISPSSLQIQFLTAPHYLNARTAPDHLRHQIIEKYTRHLEWLMPLDSWGKATSSLQSAIKFVSSPLDFDSKLFKEEISKLDHYYDVNLLAVFPELQSLDLSE